MATKRVCATPGCPRIGPGSRCEEHAREVERRRGSRQQRGYGREHDQLRRDWQRRMDAGEVVRCWRPGCEKVIDPRHWHLGHRDDRSGYEGPECPACNVSAGGKAAHR